MSRTDGDVMSSFVTILTTIGSHEMDEIFIHADNISIKNLEQCHWDRMASLLAAVRFVGLRNILFRTPVWAGDNSDMTALIREKLEECSGRGILSIEDKCYH